MLYHMSSLFEEYILQNPKASQHGPQGPEHHGRLLRKLNPENELFFHVEIGGFFEKSVMLNDGAHR